LFNADLIEFSFESHINWCSEAISYTQLSISCSSLYELLINFAA
jgi:hypothetical protein